MVFTPIREVYPDAVRILPDGSSYWCTEGDYEPLLRSFGYETLLQVDDDDYQGDSRVLFRDGDRFGILIFGWGSCSGCDQLKACENYKEIDELRDDLHDCIIWGTAAETLDYLRNHDWEGEFCWHAEETRKFVEQAIAMMEKVERR